MIYFLVNNNFHLYDVKLHISNFKKQQDFSLIQIPHTLNPQKEDANFKKIFTYQTPFQGKKKINFLYIHRLHNKIKSDLQNISEKDFLFFYTEYECLNHYIVKLFKEKGAKTFLIDQGIATYILLNCNSTSVYKLPLRLRIKLFALRKLFGYNNSNLFFSKLYFLFCKFYIII